jgi:flavin reductase
VRFVDDTRIGTSQLGSSQLGGVAAPARRAQSVEPSSLREVMSRFATGVIVITVGGAHVHGMTANAFSSVSLTPPLALCCVSHRATMHQAITSTRRFGVSVLGADQQETARYFADKRRPRGAAQFDEVDWLPGPRTGAPLLTGALAWLECELTQLYDGGDHSIFLGEVVSASRGPDGGGLLFFGGDYHELAPEPG